MWICQIFLLKVCVMDIIKDFNKINLPGAVIYQYKVRYFMENNIYLILYKMHCENDLKNIPQEIFDVMQLQSFKIKNEKSRLIQVNLKLYKQDKDLKML